MRRSISISRTLGLAVLVTAISGAAYDVGGSPYPAPVTTHPPAADAVQADTAYVLLTLAPRLAHSSARATIVRPVGAGAPDIIMVTDATTAADLNRAIEMLMTARHQFGPSVEREMHAHVPAAESSAMDLSVESGYLSDLQAATEVDIPGLGRQRSLFLALEERH